MKAKTKSKALWAKASAWTSKRRTTDYIGELPVGETGSKTPTAASIVQTKSTWSMARQCKLGEDTAKLYVTFLGGKVAKHVLSLDHHTQRREALEILGTAPKPKLPTELTAAQAEKIGLVYHDSEGDARGYCYLCSRAGFKVDRGTALSRHGFQRPGWGYTFGECVGSGLTPQETLARALIFGREKEASLAKSLAGDLVAETTARVEFELARAKARSSTWGMKDAVKLQAKLDAPAFDAEELGTTRYELERQREHNASWLEGLEAAAKRAGLDI